MPIWKGYSIIVLHLNTFKMKKLLIIIIISCSSKLLFSQVNISFVANYQNENRIGQIDKPDTELKEVIYVNFTAENVTICNNNGQKMVYPVLDFYENKDGDWTIYKILSTSNKNNQFYILLWHYKTYNLQQYTIHIPIMYNYKLYDGYISGYYVYKSDYLDL